jgi:hypothetical protein
MPSARLLPLEPKIGYPLDAIKAAVTNIRFDPRPYIFSEGDYDRTDEYLHWLLWRR